MSLAQSISEIVYDVYRPTNDILHPVLAARVKKAHVGGFGKNTREYFWVVISEDDCYVLEHRSFSHQFEPWGNCRSYTWLPHIERFQGYSCLEAVFTTVKNDTGRWAI